MAERSTKAALWYKAASAVTIASLAACQLSEKWGYVTPSPEGTSTNPTETVPSLDQIAETKYFAGMLIGEAGIGKLNSFVENVNPDPAFVAEVKGRALEELRVGEPNLDAARIQVHAFEMQGEKGNAPFPLISVSEKDDPNKLLSVFAGFGLDENGVLVPPKEGKIGVFLKLTTVQRENNLVYVGVQDRNDPSSIYLPHLFEVNQPANEVYFIPPYTDSLGQAVPVRGAKALFSLIPIETPTPETPTHQQEIEYRETLTPEQLEIYDAAPQVEGFTKFMLDSGPLSETVFYTNDKFIRVWDKDPANAEKKEVRPALLIENGERVVGLIINWRSETDIRVADEEAMKRLGALFEYQMKRFCGRSNNIPGTSSIEDIKGNGQLNSLLEAGCTITLQKMRDGYYPTVPRQYILVSNHSVLKMRWVRDEEHIPQEVKSYLAKTTYAINTDRYHAEGVAMVQGEGDIIEVYNSRSGPFNDDNPYIRALFNTFRALDSRVSGKRSAIGSDWSLFTILFRLDEGENMYARDLITTK